MFEYFWHGILGRPYTLYSKETGKTHGPVVVLLHGIAASSDDWTKVLPYLEQHYRCITIDLLGFGRSPKPQWLAYTMDDHMRSVYRTMNKLHLKSKFILVGHSLGSLLAARYATEHEKNLRRLLLLSPPVYPPLDAIKSRSTRRLTGMLLALYRYLRENPRITKQTFERLKYVAPLPRNIAKQPATWVPFMRTLKECIETQTIINDVATLTVPIDVCYGSLDQVVLAQNVKTLERKGVTVHQFLGTHDLTKRYGQQIGMLLTPTKRVSKRKKAAAKLRKVSRTAAPVKSRR